MARRNIVTLAKATPTDLALAKLAERVTELNARFAFVESAQAGTIARVQSVEDAVQDLIDGGVPLPPALGALLLSGPLTNGVASSGSIIGGTAGSVISSNIAGLSINNGARTYSFDGSAVAGTGTLTETLSGAIGSPKTSSVVVLPSAVLPTLTLANVLTSVAATISAGTKIADIGNAPSQPTVSPNDGRFVIAGSGGAYRLERGTTALTAGTTVLVTVSATGALPVAVTLTVTADVTLQPNPSTLPVYGPQTASSVAGFDTQSVNHSFSYDNIKNKNVQKIYLGDPVGDKQTAVLIEENNGVQILLRSVINGNVQNLPGTYVVNLTDNNPDGTVVGRTYSLKDGAIVIEIGGSTAFTYTKADLSKVFAGGVLGTKVSFDPYFGPGPLNNVRIAGGAIPLANQEQTLTFGTDTVTASVKLNYVKDTAPTGYTFKLGNAGVPTAMTVTSASTKGEAVCTFSFPKPPAGSPIVITYADADGSASTVGPQVNTPSPMLFGTNFTGDSFYHNMAFRNRVEPLWSNNFGQDRRELRAWNRANPEMTSAGQPTAAAIAQIMIDNQTSGILTTGPNADGKSRGDGSSQGPIALVDVPRVPGQRSRIRWKGKAGQVAINDIFGVATNRQDGSDATWFWIDYNHNYNPQIFADGGDIASLWLILRINNVGGTAPTELECIDIDANGVPLSPGKFHKDWIADNQIYNGHSYIPLRFMDCQRIIGQSDRVYTSADIADGEFPWGANGGWSVQMCLAAMQAVGNGGQINIPLLADESYLRKLGAMTAAWAAVNKMFVAHELTNEPWNSGQPAWYVCRDQGNAAGYTGSDHDKAQKWYGAQSARAMKIITEEWAKVPGASQYLITVLNVQNDSPSNINLVLSSSSDVDTYHSQWQSAPYLGLNSAAQYGANPTDANIDDWLANIENNLIPLVYGRAATIRDMALARGKSYATYEGWLEALGNAAFTRRLKADPVRYPKLVNLLCNQFKDRVGGMLRRYHDNAFEYGMRAHASQLPNQSVGTVPPAYGEKAWRDYIAAQQTVS